MSEAILEPDLPIIDPHHHLWDWRSRLPYLPAEMSHPFEAILRQSPRYLLDELLADTGSGHNVIANQMRIKSHAKFIDLCIACFTGIWPAGVIDPNCDRTEVRGQTAKSQRNILEPFEIERQRPVLRGIWQRGFNLL